uniref:Uncharacterized protein n=1 Tax=Spongospora subterranea TaxID=70186 RepID=A0A0H5RDF7_9EUKA|eukprot:CRZ12038.1 hypothetical protein [Spongospora subterranea]
MSSSSLTRIIDGFDAVEKSTALRTLKSTVKTILQTFTGDPLDNDSLRHLTSFAGSLVKTDSLLSLSFMCSPVPAKGNTFQVCHHRLPDKHRSVSVDVGDVSLTWC